jgi:hypothetical protein
MSKCPICKKELELIGDMSDDGTLHCPDDHYLYDHSYGQHKEEFNTGSELLSVTWHYTEDEVSRRKRNALTNTYLDYVLGRGNDSILRG